MSAWLAAASRAEDDPPYRPTVAGASDEPVRAMRAFRVPDGLRVEVFAAEPLLANPVAFGVDERNRFYVAETFRLHKGVTDTRQHMYWLDDDLASRTVEDRVAMYRKHLSPEEFHRYGTEHDRIRLVEDTSGDGRADHATVFADGFKGPETGLGAGVLARGDTVWYTNIPHLWTLRDTTGDGRANERTALHEGYGVHVGFIGHDLHGLVLGPDGRLYFTIGDRGWNVTTLDGRRLVHPDSGCVLRCNPDGTELEIVATGLRNPQELAFNELGDLFTCDNNSDSGDQSRWVHVVEGADNGWQIGYQFIERPNSRGPFNAEKLWYPEPENTAAYLVPPVANLSDGPSGLTYHPGTSLLPDELRGTFFLADFRGTPGQSGIRAVKVEPEGASYRLVEQRQFIWGILATDVDFGTDGALYVSDWVEGWNLTGKGRIYKVFDPDRIEDPLAQEVRTLLAEGMNHRPLEELGRLLGHADMRVRRDAQFELVERALGNEDAELRAQSPLELTASKVLAIVAKVPPVPQLAEPPPDFPRFADNPLARLHAIWGMGRVARQQPLAMAGLWGLLEDQDSEVRAQAAKMLGDLPWSEIDPNLAATTRNGLITALKDEHARVRFQAAIALGKLGDTEAVGPLLEMLRDNADADAYLRHAGVMGLAGIGDLEALLDAATDDAAAVRLGVLLALRRLESPEVARFLDDDEPRLVLEAARAINDVPINDALPALARLAERSGLAEPLGRRVLNANDRLGGPEHADALARFAAREGESEALRVEAIAMLAEWAEPTGRDRVMGLWRPLPARPSEFAADALRPVLPSLLEQAPERVREATARAVGRLAIAEAGPKLAALVTGTEPAGRTRIAALRALERLDVADLAEAAQAAVADDDPNLRAEGLSVLARLRPAEAVERLTDVLDHGTTAEQQAALRTLAIIDDPAAHDLISLWLDKMLGGQVPLDIQLDLLEAAAQHPSDEVRARIERHEAGRPSDDPLAPYRETLVGGDAERGRTTFYEKAEVACLRCHKIDGYGGTVGPDLTGIGSQHDRMYLLESIVLPDRQIAEGFETLVIATDDGQVLSGILQNDDGETLHLINADGEAFSVPKAAVEEQTRGASAMPEDIARLLSKSELRDLIEFLATLK